MQYMSFASIGSVLSLPPGTGFDPLEGLSDEESSEFQPVFGGTDNLVELPTTAMLDASLSGSHGLRNSDRSNQHAS